MVCDTRPEPMNDWRPVRPGDFRIGCDEDSVGPRPGQWSRALGNSVRGLITFSLAASVVFSSVVPPGSSRSPARVGWQQASASIDGVALGATRTEVESVLGGPARIFKSGGMDMLSFGLETTTVGLDTRGQAVRISGQTLEFSGDEFGLQSTGLGRDEARLWLGNPTKELTAAGSLDLWEYRHENTCLTLTFSSQDHTVVSYMLQKS